MPRASCGFPPIAPAAQSALVLSPEEAAVQSERKATSSFLVPELHACGWGIVQIGDVSSSGKVCRALMKGRGAWLMVPVFLCKVTIMPTVAWERTLVLAWLFVLSTLRFVCVSYCIFFLPKFI